MFDRGEWICVGISAVVIMLLQAVVLVATVTYVTKYAPGIIATEKTENVNTTPMQAMMDGKIDATNDYFYEKGYQETLMLLSDPSTVDATVVSVAAEANIQ